MYFRALGRFFFSLWRCVFASIHSSEPGAKCYIFSEQYKQFLSEIFVAVNMLYTLNKLRQKKEQIRYIDNEDTQTQY